MTKFKMIAATSNNWVIGKNGKIPWSYPGDQKRFKELTINNTVIMGRRTFESLPAPLPDRRNIVITSTPIDNIECYPSIHQAIKNIKDGVVWFIGGTKILDEALLYADEIDLTIIPTNIEGGPDDKLAYLPFSFRILPSVLWTPEAQKQHPYNPELIIKTWKKETDHRQAYDRAAYYQALVNEERKRQDIRWGPQDKHSLELWALILAEEVGEFHKAVLDLRSGSDTIEHALQELVQTSAVAQSLFEQCVVFRK